MRIAFFVVACVAGGVVGNAIAAMPNAKPGLWETVSTTVFEAGLPAGLPGAGKLPPEQRAKMEQALAPGGGKPLTTSDRMCMSSTLLDQWDAFWRTNSADCRRTIVDSTAQHVRFTIVCGGGKSTGEADFTAAGSDRIVGQMTMSNRSDRGDSTVNVHSESRWIGADCGGLKPGERQTLGGR